MASRTAAAVLSVIALSVAACADLPFEGASDRESGDLPSHAQGPPEGMLDMHGAIGSTFPPAGDDPVHDPALFQHAGTYYVASTGRLQSTADPGGIWLRRSEGTLAGPWETLGPIPVPDWVFAYDPAHLWAPQAVVRDGTVYFYYAASSFGVNTSAIGVTRSSTPADLGSWEDLGPVFTSESGDAYNAIDPTVFEDEYGALWLTFGSHFGGVFLAPMNSLTEVAGHPINIAARHSPNRVEAPTIFRRGRYYYLVTSWDTCCAFLDSTYKIAVGRAEQVTGPYTDKNGVALLQGGGTIILNRRANQVGPGGQDLHREFGRDYMVNHYYDADTGGDIRMQIRSMEWHDGSPYFPDPGGYDLQDGGTYQLRNQDAEIPCLATNEGDLPVLMPCDDDDDVSAEQRWRLEKTWNGFYRLRARAGTADACLEMASDPVTVEVRPCSDSLPVNNPHRVTAHHWHLEDMGDKHHRLLNEATGLALHRQESALTGQPRSIALQGDALQHWQLMRVD